MTRRSALQTQSETGTLERRSMLTIWFVHHLLGPLLSSLLGWVKCRLSPDQRHIQITVALTATQPPITHHTTTRFGATNKRKNLTHKKQALFLLPHYTVACGERCAMPLPVTNTHVALAPASASHVYYVCSPQNHPPADQTVPDLVQSVPFETGHSIHALI